MADSAEHVNDREAMLWRAEIRVSAQTARACTTNSSRPPQREQIVAAAGALAVIEEELAWVHPGPRRRPSRHRGRILAAGQLGHLVGPPG